MCNGVLLFRRDEAITSQTNVYWRVFVFEKAKQQLYFSEFLSLKCSLNRNLVHLMLSCKRRQKKTRTAKLKTKTHSHTKSTSKMQWQLHESQHLWCSKINCGSITCLFVQRNRQPRRSISQSKHLYSVQNIHTYVRIIICEDSATVLQSITPIRFIFLPSASESVLSMATTATAASTAFVQFINRLHFVRIEKSEHLDICSLNRLRAKLYGI